MNTEEMQKQIESMMPTPEQIVEHLDKKLEEAETIRRSKGVIMEEKDKNLYKLKNKLGVFYVVATSFDDAAKVLTERLDKADYGYPGDRYVDSIEIVAKEHFFKEKQLFFANEQNLIVSYYEAPSVSDTDKSFINDIKSIINEAPGVFQSDKNRLIAWLEKHSS